MNFQQEFFGIIDNVVRNLKGQPLNLGGYMASGGGSGGPPGGYIGQLPQSRVAYDLTEAESAVIPVSGASLVDNLNHIRYRLTTMETSGSYGIDVKQDGITIATDISIIDFENSFTVISTGVDEVSISLLSSGVQSDVTYSGVYGEDLTSQITGSEDHFTIAGVSFGTSLEVYLNGIRQSRSEYVIDEDYKGFTTSFTPIVNDTLLVDYIVKYDGYFHTHSQYLTSGSMYTIDQINLLLANKASLIHTHTISDITDLTDPLVVNQQIIFTIASSGCSTAGTKPLRIYAHDVNDGAEITEIFVAFNTPPNAEVHLNVLKNGSTIFTTPAYMVIASGAYTTSRITNFLSDAFAKDDYFQIAVDTTNTVASDMTLHIRFSYEL